VYVSCVHGSYNEVKSPIALGTRSDAAWHTLRTFVERHTGLQDNAQSWRSTMQKRIKVHAVQMGSCGNRCGKHAIKERDPYVNRVRESSSLKKFGD
jgi:hypothetical protein